MIEQHTLWRHDLLKSARALEARYRQRRWSDRTRHAVERDVFLSFYAIRKLIEANLLKPRIVNARHTVAWYPIIIGQKPSTDPTMFVFTYLLYHGRQDQLTVWQISNQFIHSFIFSPFRMERGDMLGIFFASERESKIGLYYITLVKIIEILLSAAHDRPVVRHLTQRANDRLVAT